MGSPELQQFQSEVERLAAVIGAPASLLPTYGRSEDFARPHIEFLGGQFHFVVEERGVQLQRESSPNPDDILYSVFEGITFSMAGDYEVRHRRPSEDSRRQLFDVQLQLLGKLSGDWQQRRRAHLGEILRQYPFSDEPRPSRQ
ncbi:MAG TPA: Imm63 family immunity protein [Tepidisphaeraceae bacterium]|jgi:hypothetical protein